MRVRKIIRKMKKLDNKDIQDRVLKKKVTKISIKDPVSSPSSTNSAPTTKRKRSQEDDNKSLDDFEKRKNTRDRNDTRDKNEKVEPPQNPDIFDIHTVEDIISGLKVSIKKRKFSDEDIKVLVPKDYSYSYQFKMEIDKKDHPHVLLKFKDFAPKVFAQIRNYFGVQDRELLGAFKTLENLKSIKGEGKSGAFFIFTKDRQFILKTCFKEERDFLWQILPEYLKHIRENPDTLLPRFYGVYSMKHEGIGGVIRFVIMQNIFCSPYQPIEIYDLKGSTVGRKTEKKNRKPGVILKDLDIKDSRHLWIPDKLRKQFLVQLKIDSDFLASVKVMDYSLLVGIHYQTEENEKETKRNIRRFKKLTVWHSIKKNLFMQDSGGIEGMNTAEDRKEIYFMGIIDILIKFEAKKKMENFFKKIPYGDEVSVIPPTSYSDRFYSFIKGLLPHAEEEDEEDTDTTSSSKAKKKKKTTGDIYARRENNPQLSKSLGSSKELEPDPEDKSD